MLTLLDGASVYHAAIDGSTRSVVAVRGGPPGSDDAVVSLGLEMLAVFVSHAPAIRPLSGGDATTRNPSMRWAHSLQYLETATAVLLSHVVRRQAAATNANEAQAGAQGGETVQLGLHQAKKGKDNPP